jgi:riboflavin kinase/FMN adenylyltransferase
MTTVEGSVLTSTNGSVGSVENRDDLVVEGVVVRGDRRGRELGFPTANVDVRSATVLPADGVYAGWLERPDGSRYVAAISVGLRPTYYAEGGRRLLEAYLLGFEGDLYGEVVRVGVGGRVRGQVRFESSEQLIEQMHRDVEAVRAAAPI